MSRKSANSYTTPLVWAIVTMAQFALVPAHAQGFFDRAQSLFEDDDETEDTTPSADAGLTKQEISGGLTEALHVARERVVGQLGSAGGFSADPAVHIPLPDSLGRIQSALDRIGQGGQLEHLEFRLNQGAEAAVPRAKRLFMNSISAMTMEDAIAIYRGSDDAATQYFRQQMSTPLAAEMLPVVEESLQDVGAAQTLETVMDYYNDLPFTREIDADINSYVVDKALDGVFYYLAQEEQAIRRDPVHRTSELLQRLFDN